MAKIIYGDKVSWEYTHHLNSKSSTQIVKIGEYQGLIRHTIKHRGKQLAAVWFKGNKTVSRIPFDELRRVGDQPPNAVA